jgi:hypothetical protein
MVELVFEGKQFSCHFILYWDLHLWSCFGLGFQSPVPLQLRFWALSLGAPAVFLRKKHSEDITPCTEQGSFCCSCDPFLPSVEKLAFLLTNGGGRDSPTDGWVGPVGSTGLCAPWGSRSPGTHKVADYRSVGRQASWCQQSGKAWSLGTIWGSRFPVLSSKLSVSMGKQSQQVCPFRCPQGRGTPGDCLYKNADFPQSFGAWGSRSCSSGEHGSQSLFLYWEMGLTAEHRGVELRGTFIGGGWGVWTVSCFSL